jgi:hypothetical protein
MPLYFNVQTNLTSWDSSVGIAMGYVLDSWGSITGRGRNLSLLHNVQTSSGDHPTSYPMGIRNYLPMGKVARS